MGLIYLDSSVFVSLLLADSNSVRARAWLSGFAGLLLVGDFAVVETGGVISRTERTGEITEAQADAAWLDLVAMRDQSERWRHGAGDFAESERLVRDRSLKLSGADALHLASAINAKASMATFDLRLQEAARARGVGVEAIG